MKVLGFSGTILLYFMAFVSLASADTLQLRNGRHLQGKFIGGTSTAIGFMSGASVEYFPTADVLVLIFDNGADPSLGGSQSSPMSGDCSMGAARVTNTRRLTRSNPTTRERSIPFQMILSQPDEDGNSFELSNQLWFTAL